MPAIESVAVNICQSTFSIKIKVQKYKKKMKQQLFPHYSIMDVVG